MSRTCDQRAEVGRLDHSHENTDLTPVPAFTLLPPPLVINVKCEDVTLVPVTLVPAPAGRGTQVNDHWAFSNLEARPFLAHDTLLSSHESKGLCFGIEHGEYPNLSITS